MDHDSSEFVALLTTSQAVVYAYIRTLLTEREAAMDVLQEVNLTACKKSSDYNRNTSFNAWVTKIAHFHVLAYRRKMSRDRLLFDDRVFDYLAERQSERSEDSIVRAQALQSCLDALPVDSRRLLEQRYQEGGSVQRIAQLEGARAGAVSQRLYRLRELLLECVRRKLAQGVLA